MEHIIYQIIIYLLSVFENNQADIRMFVYHCVQMPSVFGIELQNRFEKSNFTFIKFFNIVLTAYIISLNTVIFNHSYNRADQAAKGTEIETEYCIAQL